LLKPVGRLNDVSAVQNEWTPVSTSWALTLTVTALAGVASKAATRAPHIFKYGFTISLLLSEGAIRGDDLHTQNQSAAKCRLAGTGSLPRNFALTAN
jgi:hypothetical protein